MARRKKSKFNLGEYVPEVESSVKRGIFIVFIFLLAILSLLSIFDLAGIFGRYFYQLLKILLGWDFWVFPILLFAMGYLSLDNTRPSFNSLNWAGAILFIVGLTGLSHLFQDPADYKAVLGQATGGGYVGYALAAPLYKLMGVWAGRAVALALILSGLILMLRMSLEELLDRISLKSLRVGIKNWWLSRKYGENEIDDEEEEEEDEEEEEEEGGIETADGEEEEEELEFEEKEVGNGEPGFEEEEEENKSEQLVLSNNLTQAKTKKKKKYPRINLPLSLLDVKSGKPKSGDIKAHQDVIKQTLKNFGIEVEMGEVTVGPTVTQYTFRPAEGVKLSRIIGLSNNLALALAAHSIRIEAPIPGKSLVGIEVPNKQVAIVPLRTILESKTYKQRKSNMQIALGQDVAGKPWLINLAQLPHLLVAGQTGSGKSVCLNSIIVSLLYQNQPDELKLILVDPKMVEMQIYNGIPHLLVPAITEPKKAINALKWTISEMERRLRIMSNAGKRNIQSYNNAHPQDKLPYLVFIIDELASLMNSMGGELETVILHLTQKGRAAGIHLIIATQRPSVDIVTGSIKVNIPGRIAFSVNSLMDSRTILDVAGAEKLVGKGDMLFKSDQVPKPKRLQGAYCSDEDIERVVQYLRDRAQPDYEESVVDGQQMSLGGVVMVGAENSEASDELLPQARELVVEAGKASASYLQRRLSIGYARAARLLDILEEQGVVGPSEGSKAREVLIKPGEKSLVEQADDILETGITPEAEEDSLEISGQQTEEEGEEVNASDENDFKDSSEDEVEEADEGDEFEADKGDGLKEDEEEDDNEEDEEEDDSDNISEITEEDKYNF